MLQEKGNSYVLTRLCRTIAVLSLLVASGCGHSTKSYAAWAGCQNIQGLPSGNPLLFGELPGSAEMPALVFQVACSLASSREIAVGLEIPSEEQSLIDTYLMSRGTEVDKKKLMSSDFWQRGRDGRSSSAMLGLIDDVRRLRESGAPIVVFAFDDQPGTDLDRDIAIANGIRRFHDLHPKKQIVALMGNVHAMQEPIKFGAKTLVPSGKLLKDLHPVSILIAYPKGSVWSCMPDCGIHEIPAANSFTGSPGFGIGTPPKGYDYTFSLSSITASPPAAQKAP